MFGLALALALTVVLVVSAGWWIVRRRRTPPELRGDWWALFEADFRAYVRRSEPPGRPRRPRDSGSIGQ